MKIEKLPSGSYRMRKMYKGKMYTVVTDYKPTQKEAIQPMVDELDKVQEKHREMTFRIAAEKYIETKKNVLSPATIRGYTSIIHNILDKFMGENVHDITPLDVQSEVNRLAKEHTPKTIRNYHGFISAVLSTFCPNLRLNTTLPQKVKNEPYIPSDDEVKRILEYAKGTDYEIPLILACYGLRRSEICALTLEDINGDVVSITKAKVLDEDKNWVIKSTKTTSSTREVIIPAAVADQIRRKGYIYNGYPDNILKFLKKSEDTLGIREFPLHKLRHYFASKMSAMNVPDADIINIGGWETDHVMKSVYRHSIDREGTECEEKRRGKPTESPFFLIFTMTSSMTKSLTKIYFLAQNKIVKINRKTGANPLSMQDMPVFTAFYGNNVDGFESRMLHL